MRLCSKVVDVFIYFNDELAARCRIACARCPGIRYTVFAVTRRGKGFVRQSHERQSRFVQQVSAGNAFHLRSAVDHRSRVNEIRTGEVDFYIPDCYAYVGIVPIAARAAGAFVYQSSRCGGIFVYSDRHLGSADHTRPRGNSDTIRSLIARIVIGIRPKYAVFAVNLRQLRPFRAVAVIAVFHGSYTGRAGFGGYGDSHVAERPTLFAYFDGISALVVVCAAQVDVYVVFIYFDCDFLGNGNAAGFVGSKRHGHDAVQVVYYFESKRRSTRIFGNANVLEPFRRQRSAVSPRRDGSNDFYRRVSPAVGRIRSFVTVRNRDCS